MYRTSYPSWHALTQSQQCKHHSNVYCLKLTIKTPEPRQWHILEHITLNIFQILFWCFHYWLWTSKYQLGSSWKLSVFTVDFEQANTSWAVVENSTELSRVTFDCDFKFPLLSKYLFPMVYSIISLMKKSHIVSDIGEEQRN